MSSRPRPGPAPDMTAVLVSIVRDAVPGDVTVGRKLPRDSSGSPAGRKFVQVRADLQNQINPLARYCRAGFTVWWLDQTGRARVDEAFDLCALAVDAVLRARHSTIIHSEWAAGPLETTDSVSGLEVAYATVLLEVVSDF